MHQISFNDVQLMEYARMAPSRTAFIDESGNFGFDFSLAGTSKFYVICAIIVETAYLQSLQERVIEAKRTVGFAESEMKSSIIGSNRGRRVRLLQELLNVDFQAVVLVANKQKLIEGSPLREYKKSFIKYLNQKLYTMLYQVYPKLQIVADEQGNSEFQSSFQSYVENNRPLPNLLNEFDFGFCDSKADVLIQVADIIAGTIAITYEEKEFLKNFLQDTHHIGEELNLKTINTPRKYSYWHKKAHAILSASMKQVLSNQVRNFGLRLPCHAACLSSDLSESSLRYPLVTDQSSEYSIRYTVTSRR